MNRHRSLGTRATAGRGNWSRSRRGAVAVEMALVAPLFVLLAWGMAEASRLYDVQNQLHVAAREGARVASMDRRGLTTSNETTNAKVVRDVRNILEANGLPSEQVEVAIVDPFDHATPFDLDSPVNRLELFELKVALPYAALVGVDRAGDLFTISARVVFRNARSVVAQ